jgi:hypothetical protein
MSQLCSTEDPARPPAATKTFSLAKTLRAQRREEGGISFLAIFASHSTPLRAGFARNQALLFACPMSSWRGNLRRKTRFEQVVVRRSRGFTRAGRTPTLWNSPIVLPRVLTLRLRVLRDLRGSREQGLSGALVLVIFVPLCDEVLSFRPPPSGLSLLTYHLSLAAAPPSPCG